MTLPLPDHCYVPGQTARHAEGAFAHVHALTPAETTGAAGNPAWAYGLDLLEAGYNWEAHEVLEPVWLNAAPNSAERMMVQAAIQLANAALKHRMDRPAAARRLCDITAAMLREVGFRNSHCMGLAVADMMAATVQLRADIDANRANTMRVRADSMQDSA